MNNLVVISGVAGMTGNELARQYLSKGFKVIGFDNFFSSSIKSIEDILKNSNFSFFEYDINNTIQLNEIKCFIKKKFKCFIKHFVNCAAVVHTRHFYNINDTFITNVLSMKAFLDLSIELKANTFINCSTSEVYSMQSWVKNGVKEVDPVLLATAENSQRTSYAAGKLLTEFFLKDAVQNDLIKGCSIRFANVYSQDELTNDHIIPFIIDSLKNNKKVTLLENSKVNKRTFLHNYDSCSSIIELINSPASLDGSIYNVGTSEEVSIIELVEKIAEKMNINNFTINYQGFRENDPERRLICTNKIKKITNWQENISLDKGLDMCIKSRLSND